jgi:hypothetical protein
VTISLDNMMFEWYMLGAGKCTPERYAGSPALLRREDVRLD